MRNFDPNSGLERIRLRREKIERGMHSSRRQQIGWYILLLLVIVAVVLIIVLGHSEAINR